MSIWSTWLLKYSFASAAPRRYKYQVFYRNPVCSVMTVPEYLISAA